MPQHRGVLRGDERVGGWGSTLVEARVGRRKYGVCGGDTGKSVNV